MMLTGRIVKGGPPCWCAECEIIGAYTDGTSRKDALMMLADCIETKIDHAGLKVTVTEIGESALGGYDVLVDSSEPAVLAAEVLRHQRQKNRLSLADVAKKLGSSSRNAYASYEQGAREPSLSKFRELLAAVAPDMVLSVGPRTSAKRKTKLR